MQRFAGRVAIVTGGSSGIGEAVARGLAEEGARVVIAARRNGEAVASITRNSSTGTSIPPFRCDESGPRPSRPARSCGYAPTSRVS